MTALAPLYIKKAYKDEPSFRDAKVVFSLYDNDFKEPFHPDFASKLLLKGISKKDVADLKEPVDYTALCKLAVDYSDGVIQQSEHVNEEVIAYARQNRQACLRLSISRNLCRCLQRLLRPGFGEQNKNKVSIRRIMKVKYLGILTFCNSGFLRMR